MRNNRLIRTIAYVLVMSCFLGMVTGCSKEGNTKIILTTGFEKDEVFRLGDSNCTTPEIMVYLTNLQNQYEAIYGKEIWNTKVDGVTLEENIKDVALSRMAQVKTMTLLAKEQGVILTEKELAAVDEITDMYFDSLSQNEKETLNITRELIYNLYTEYAISTKVYESIIKDINPEISDDEARTITIKHIFIKTFNYDDDGNKVPYDSDHKDEARRLAFEIRQRIEQGEDFDTLAREYSNDEEITLSFGKGEKETAFEVAAFELGKDELSEVVDTDHGFEIIKCVSTFNREVTDENKIKIVEKRKQEAFTAEYEEFAKGLTKNINEELWDEITFVHSPDITTRDFFELFDENYNIM